MERSAIRENLRTHRFVDSRPRIALRSIRATTFGTAGEFQMTGLVPIPTLKIWNQDIDASQYRTRCTREYVLRSIRRSAQAASIGVWYRAGPPFEAAPHFPKTACFPGDDLTFRALIREGTWRQTPLLAGVFLARISLRSAEIAARIVGMAVAPLLHQCLKLAIVPVRQDDLGGDEQIPDSPRSGQALALEAERAAAGGVFRDRQFDRAAKRRHADLAAKHGFIERDRQIDAQIA